MQGKVEAVETKFDFGPELATVVGLRDGAVGLASNLRPKIFLVDADEEGNFGDGEEECGQFLYLNFMGRFG